MNDHSRLSRDLHDLATAICTKSLPKVHSNCFARLNMLIYQDQKRKAEYELLKRYIKANKRYNLVSCEYFFDDGSFTQGHGDALLYDDATHTLVVLETKICKKFDPFISGERKRYVRLQAHMYACRLRSWLVHLITVDPLIRNAMAGCTLVAAYITDASSHLTFLEALHSHDLFLT